MSATPAPAREGFRRDIEGLRAVAALLVAVYHIWLGRVSGGVDVFFVIAGFLITGTLLRQLERTGQIRPGRYLGRLLVRLLPNALTVLAAVLVATLTLLPITRRADVIDEVIASALYVENWHLIASSVDYLARDREDSPVQHFWAMSIQGQFYLIWLVLALVAVAVGARHAARRRLVGLVALVTVASFVTSLVMTALDQPVAYFHTATRAWEFGVGALVALGVIALPALQLTDRGERILGWTGLGLILATGMVLPVASAFPGIAAAVPVGGAVLILLASRPVRGSAAQLLSARPLVSLGSVAYALYLWHWPVLVFTLHLRGVDRVGLLDGLFVLGISVVLAYASTHLVERPVRALSWERRGDGFAPAAGATAALILVGTAGSVGAVATPRMPVGDDVRLAHWALPTSRPDFAMPASENPYPGVLAAAADLPTMTNDGCHQDLATAEVKRCTYGDPDAQRTMVLVGGSHSAHWQPALHEIGVQLGWRVETMTKSGCRQGLSLVGPEHALYSQRRIADSCVAWNEEMLRLIVAERPDLVVANTTVIDDGQEYLPAYYEQFWRELDGHGIAMLGIRGTPRADFNRVDCLAEHGPSSPRCDLPRDQTLSEVDPAVELAAELDGLVLADINDWLCTPTSCPAVIEDTIVYYDAHHLSATFSRALAQPLFRAAPQVFGD